MSEAAEHLFLVGEFSRLTHLTAKTLRHYHDVDLLVPVVVDPGSGYRYYTSAQIPRAQLIRRLRDVRMPVPQIREALAAPEGPGRDAVIGRHLEQLQRELLQTAVAVGSLRSMLSPLPWTPPVTYRPGVGESALTVVGDVVPERIEVWFADVFTRLFAAARQVQAWPSGAGGALYSGDWFSGQSLTVTALLPVGAGSDPDGDPGGERGVRLLDLGAQPYAVAVHEGSFADLDRTYAALGEHVHAAGIAAEGPIRENYLISPADTSDPAALRTEVCWPVTHFPTDEGDL
ncbi:MerR family transcriptional regulator [Kineosporia sp. NBRC 101677]|uniref:MerR family transcriptional regulator n=1 Tax=Kineosporia sp. NBRC 101677 TaxID=3032197 RepID=UPI0024A41203|nr:MerR family transcriptional regulator [Kineosporia sp. NBRC 101677]GLY16457.1 MerR family transcriptional regulator [Kineosporia sp. NBRC 101677]